MPVWQATPNNTYCPIQLSINKSVPKIKKPIFIQLYLDRWYLDYSHSIYTVIPYANPIAKNHLDTNHTIKATYQPTRTSSHTDDQKVSAYEPIIDAIDTSYPSSDKVNCLIENSSFK